MKLFGIELCLSLLISHKFPQENFCLTQSYGANYPCVPVPVWFFRFLFMTLARHLLSDQRPFSHRTLDKNSSALSLLFFEEHF